MRRYIIGAIVGLIIGLSATAYADDLENLVGAKVDGQTAVYLDGKRLDTAIIIDGKSYAPTRKIAEASGKGVSFQDGGIYLESQETTVIPEETPAEPSTPAENPTPPVKTYSIEAINSEIKTLNMMKKSCEGSIEIAKSDKSLDDAQRQQTISNLEQKLTEIQTELDTWLQRKAELEG